MMVVNLINQSTHPNFPKWLAIIRLWVKNEHIGNRTQVLGPEIPCTTTMLYALVSSLLFYTILYILQITQDQNYFYEQALKHQVKVLFGFEESKYDLGLNFSPSFFFNISS